MKVIGIANDEQLCARELGADTPANFDGIENVKVGPENKNFRGSPKSAVTIDPRIEGDDLNKVRKCS